MFEFFRKKKGIFSLATALTIAFGTIAVSAASVSPRISQYYLAEGVGHVDYYISSSASGYTNLIHNAANSWVDTGYGWNPIYMYHTTNFDASNMDIFAGSYGTSAGYNGRTAYIDVRTEGHVNVSATSSFWDYGEIYLNNSILNSYDSNSKQGVICHEMGHVFGLAEHNDNTSSVMCQESYGRAVYRPGLADHNGINAMY